MPKKKADRRLLLRKTIKDRSKATTSIAKEPFKFTKTAVSKIESPPKSQRHTYRDTLTPNLCLRVTPTAKTFYWQKTIRGSQKRVTIGRFPEINVEQARVLAADIAADYAKGTDVQKQRREGKEIFTLDDLWEDFRENRKRKLPGKYSTALDYQWKKYFEKWKNTPLSDITRHKARIMILGIRKKAPFHANRIQRHGQAMFNHALKELQWEGKNPFDFALVPEKKRSRKERLRKSDMPSFLKGLDACSEGMRLLFLTALYTGRRMGEVQSMDWDFVDLKSGVWTITETKSDEIQTALLPKQLIELLEQWQENKQNHWVFPSPSKSGHVEEIKGAWSKVRKASDLHHLQARDLRRTFISWAQEAGVPIAAVQVQVGHADIATTAKHYTVFSESERRKGLNQAITSLVDAGTTNVHRH